MVYASLALADSFLNEERGCKTFYAGWYFCFNNKYDYL